MIETLSAGHALEPILQRHPRRTFSGLYRHAVKRMTDLFLCILMLPLAFPVIGIMYLLVRLDGGPGFYGHVRIGKSGRPFKCWKLRTMVTHSHERLAAFLLDNPAAQAEWNRDHKLRYDPRVTYLGRILRQTSLDELPQIWNVLRGDMSLVGPRPVTRPELIKYGSGRRAYLTLRPGITGLWQVSGRNDVTYDQRVEMDVMYQQSLTWHLDAEILLRTVGVVLHRTGL
jgi:lipopolysaccharide/colanic/teichoic acid biosynthesis glycosyltransferase